MREPKFPLHLTSPHERGQRVKDAQYLLKNNRFKTAFYKGQIDGDFGPESAKAANDARWFLGYQKKNVYTNRYGDTLHKFLLGPERHGDRLTPLMVTKRKARLKEAEKKNTVKLRALELAKTQVGTKESPQYSNNQKYGVWYGLNYQPWCAIFVTWCFVNSGDTRTFARSSRSAWALWPLNMARANLYGLSVTTHPEPGDLVVYTHGEGHIGIFDKWLDTLGSFQTVEGNTSAESDANGGEVEIRQRHVGDYMQPHFIRYL